MDVARVIQRKVTERRTPDPTTEDCGQDGTRLDLDRARALQFIGEKALIPHEILYVLQGEVIFANGEHT